MRMRTLVQRRCHLTTEQECCSSCCSQPPALQCSGGRRRRKCVSYVCYMCHMISCWWRDWMAPALFIVITEVYVCVCVCVCAHVCRHIQHMWIIDSAYFTACTCDKEGEVWKTEERKTGRGGGGREECASGRERGWERIRERARAESVIWLLRNSAGDSCRYTWSDSLPLQLCGPHAQYDFTTSSLSLEIPFFHAALSPPSLLSVCWLLPWQRGRCTT